MKITSLCIFVITTLENNAIHKVLGIALGLKVVHKKFLTN